MRHHKQTVQLREMSKAELTMILRRAVIIGSLTTTKKGATTAFPSQKEIDTLLSRYQTRV